MQQPPPSPVFDSSNSISSLLQEHFGFKSLRPSQEKIIEDIVAGHNVMVIMPTGGGKSLCYQLPALILPGICIVISPLIALMKDQCDKLAKLRISASYLHSGMSFDEMAQILELVRQGQIKLLYVSPERLSNEFIQTHLKDLQISMIAIDEAHCISQWGHDFRPSYLQLKNVIKILKPGVVGVFTATATNKVKKDMVAGLGKLNFKNHIVGFDRPNIVYLSMELKENQKKTELCRIIKSFNPLFKGIVYCSTKKSIAQISALLNSQGIQAGIYHGSLDSASRQQVQNAFLENKIRVLVATNAFGMGIDKKDIRFVIHFNLPASIEAYYQESGRAGRDGNKSFALLMSNSKDFNIQKSMIERSSQDEGLLKKISAILLQRRKRVFPLQVDQLCFSLQNRYESYALINALKFMASQGRLTLIGEKDLAPSLSFDQDLNILIDSYQEQTPLGKILRELQFIYPQSDKEHHLFFSWEHLVSQIGLDKLNLMGAIHSGKAKGIYYHAPHRGYEITLNFKNMVEQTEWIDSLGLSKKKEILLSKLIEMRVYTKKHSCRRYYLLNYFGSEDLKQTCGRCDVCLEWKPKVESI